MIFAGLLAAACCVELVALGWIWREEVVYELGFVALASTALLAALSQYQAGAGTGWLGAAVFVTVHGAIHVRRLRSAAGGWSPREERALAALFGERWWQLLIQDPRLASWPRLRHLLRVASRAEKA